MPPRQKIPAPIDRPLSRAYLREFSGWSTAYPPGVSEPTSLRVMENMMVNRDGSLRVRPGLKYLSFRPETPQEPYGWYGIPADLEIVGTHEAFRFGPLTAYLFAVRESDGRIRFRVGYPANGSTVGGSWVVHQLTDPEIGFTVTGDISFDGATTYVKYLQVDGKILALSDYFGETPRVFTVNGPLKAYKPSEITRPDWVSSDKTIIKQPSYNAITNPATYHPYDYPITATTAGPPGTLSIHGSESASYPTNLGYFYTFSNDFGESEPSQIDVRKPRRHWSQWRWETPTTDGQPSGTATADPLLVADQFCIWPGTAAFAQAASEGATAFNVYVLLWSDQDPMPVEGLLVGTKEITAGMQHKDCFVRHSPEGVDATRMLPKPTADNRVNYTTPSKATNGLVAAERVVLMGDPNDDSLVQWSSNRTHEHLNFSPAAGGGYKRFSSGGLFSPVAARLWQNPESKDTLTILCTGIDGHSTSYYMAPAQIGSQSDTTSVMAFEETTATPGTVAPYGVEVLNNALYHPLETELMKSTASNYNISHKPMTEQISNVWQRAKSKRLIVSSQLDNRLYYLVDNQDGEPTEPGCRGNEIWVCDTAVDGGTWSRWLIQAQSLRKLKFNGRIVMSVVRPDGVYYLNDLLTATEDEYTDPVDRRISSRAIPWKIESNTQGANRAHDAWAHLRQVSVTLGNWRGSLRWGVRGWDVHGQAVDVSKVTRDLGPHDTDWKTDDIEDHLPVRREMKEWRFYAESVGTEQSAGQISLVQYRYAPVSVNVGYEYGDVETFEYRRNETVGNDTLYANGVPIPYVDARRP